MVNQSSSAKPAGAALKLTTQHSRYPSAAVNSVSSPPAKSAAGKATGSTPHTAGSDVRASTVKDLHITKPMFVLGSSSTSQTAAASSTMRSKKAPAASHPTGDTSPAVQKPGESNKRSRLSTSAMSMSASIKRGADKVVDTHSKLSTSMTSMKVFSLSGSTPSKIKSGPVLQSVNFKSSTLPQKGDDTAPLSSSSTKSQIGAARPHPRSLQLANPQPAQSIDISRSSPGTRLAAKLQSKSSIKLDPTPSKSSHTRSSIKPKQGLTMASSSVLETIKASASTALARRTKASTVEGDTDKPSSSRARRSSAYTVTPIKARSPLAGSLLRSRVTKDSDGKVGASPGSGMPFNTGAAAHNRTFPRQSVDYDGQPEMTASPVTATPSKPPPPVPRLNLAAVLSQSQEMNLPHHQPDMVVSPTAPSPSTATAQQHSRQSKGSAGSAALGSAPQEDHFYMYKSVTPEERRQWEALIKRLPRCESKQVKKLWDALLDARHNCEGMAFRGHRLLDQMKNDFIAYKHEAEKKMAEVEFDRQRLAALLQAKEAPVTRKPKTSDTRAARDQSRGTPSVDTCSSVEVEGSLDSGKSEGKEDLEYRARIIATSETAHILMKQLMEKEAIQNDLQNQVTDLQKLVYCLANIAKHLLNDQPPRPSAAHLVQWREFVHKLLQQAAYQAASTKATCPNPSKAPSAAAPSQATCNHPQSTVQNTAVSSPMDPPPAPRYRSPRDGPILPSAPLSTTPTHKNTISPSCLSPSSSDEMDFSPAAPDPTAAISPTVTDPTPMSPDIVRQQPFLINVPGARRSIGSHILDIDNGLASTAPTSPIDHVPSDRSRPVSDPDAPNSASLSSPETSGTPPSESEATESNRAQHAPPAPLFSQQQGPMKSPVPPLRLNTLQLRDKLENLELHSNTDRSAAATAPSSLTTPNSPSQLFYPPLTAIPTPRSPSQREEALRSHIHSLITSTDNHNQQLLQDNCIADRQLGSDGNPTPAVSLQGASRGSDADVANSRKRKGAAVEDITSPITHPPPVSSSHIDQCPFPQSNPMFNISTQAETESGSVQGGEEEDVEREVTSMDTTGCAGSQLQVDVKAIVRQACAKRSDSGPTSFPRDLRVHTELSAAQHNALQAEHAEDQAGFFPMPKTLTPSMAVLSLSPQAHPVAVGAFHNHNFGQEDLIPESPCLLHSGNADFINQESALAKHKHSGVQEATQPGSTHTMPSLVAASATSGTAVAGGTHVMSSVVGAAATSSAGVAGGVPVMPLLSAGGTGGIGVVGKAVPGRLSQDSTSLRAYTTMHGNPSAVGGQGSHDGQASEGGRRSHEGPTAGGHSWKAGEKKLGALQSVAEESFGVKSSSNGLRSFQVNGFLEERLSESEGTAMGGRASERETKSVGMVVGTVTAQTTHASRLDSLRNDLARLKLSTEARIHDVERLVRTGAKASSGGGRIEEREDVFRAEMAVHDNALVMGEERGQLMLLDSCPLELPLPNSMPGFGIASVRLP